VYTELNGLRKESSSGSRNKNSGYIIPEDSLISALEDFEVIC
jgi:hypothetical protein